MSIIEQLVADYESKSNDMKSLEVELGGKPLIIYAKPISLTQRDKILKFSEKAESNLALYVYALIECALDKDGKNVFQSKHKPLLMNQVDGSILIKMGQFVYSDNEDDNSKNS